MILREISLSGTEEASQISYKRLGPEDNGNDKEGNKRDEMEQRKPVELSFGICHEST